MNNNYNKFLQKIWKRSFDELDDYANCCGFTVGELPESFEILKVFREKFMGKVDIPSPLLTTDTSSAYGSEISFPNDQFNRLRNLIYIVQWFEKSLDEDMEIERIPKWKLLKVSNESKNDND